MRQSELQAEVAAMGEEVLRLRSQVNELTQRLDRAPRRIELDHHQITQVIAALRAHDNGLAPDGGPT